jgi:U4/U6.U5 tri-snRNP component SNU23
MSEKKTASGAASDTHRRTWDRSEYAAQAADREQKERAEAKERYEAKAAGKKFVRHVSPTDASTTASREKRLDVSAQLGKTSLVPASAAVGKKGRGAGFYCQDCDLTFKDNLQWVDHLNSRQHLVSVGESGMVERATLEMVIARLEYLKRKREEDDQGEVVDLAARLELRKENEEKAREEKRLRRKEARKSGKDSNPGEEQAPMDEDEAAMASMMGFHGFGSTKVT